MPGRQVITPNVLVPGDAHARAHGEAALGVTSRPMPPPRPFGSRVRNGSYNGLHPTTPTRVWGIDSPCCTRFERRTLCFAHALVGTVVCAWCGVLPTYWNTYLGHIGPASVMFVLSELERFPGPNTIVAQGWTAVIGGFGYLLYDLFFSKCGWDMGCHSLREQQHIALNSLLIVVGFDMIVHRSRFSASLIGIGFVLFVSLHEQPNSLGLLIHKMAGVFLGVYAVARQFKRFDICSKSLYYASYLFFYGQNGFMKLYGGNQGGSGEEMVSMATALMGGMNGTNSTFDFGVNGTNATSTSDVPEIIKARVHDTAYVLFVLCFATVMSTVTEFVDGSVFAEGLFVGIGKETANRNGTNEFETIKLVDDFTDDFERGAGERKGDL